MKTVERWRWWVHHDGTGKLYKTRHWMTREDALATDPRAEPVEGTRRELQVPESPDEHQHTQAGKA